MNNIWIRLIQGYQNVTQRSLESLPPKVQFSCYARFDGNHIQNVDFVKFILQEPTVRNKNSWKFIECRNVKVPIRFFYMADIPENAAQQWKATFDSAWLCLCFCMQAPPVPL